MPKYLIEREVPNVGSLTQADWYRLACGSLAVLNDLGIQWVESYVVDDKVYCVYIAPNERVIQEHASRVGFPANRIAAIRTVMDPTTAEDALTDREIEVLRLASKGLTRRAIAQQLCLSEATVRHHLEHIYGKIGTSTRVGAARYAMEQGLLE